MRRFSEQPQKIKVFLILSNTRLGQICRVKACQRAVSIIVSMLSHLGPWFGKNSTELLIIQMVGGSGWSNLNVSTIKCTILNSKCIHKQLMGKTKKDKSELGILVYSNNSQSMYMYIYLHGCAFIHGYHVYICMRICTYLCACTCIRMFLASVH